MFKKASTSRAQALRASNHRQTWRELKLLSFMDEPELHLEGVALSPQKETVRVFYKELWDHADKSLIPRIFHADFTLSATTSSLATSTG